MNGAVPDYDLFAGFREGDFRACSDLYTLHYTQLFCFVQQVTGKSDEAGNIVTETFIKLLQRRKLFDSMVNIKAFLHLTARNNCMQYLQFTNQKNNSSTEELTDRTLKPVNADERVDAIDPAIVQQLKEATEQLPGMTSKVLELFYRNGSTNTDIATELGITPLAVVQHKAKALRLLQKSLSVKARNADLFLIYYLAILLPGEKTKV